MYIMEDFEKLVDEAANFIDYIASKPRMAIILNFESEDFINQIEDIDIIQYCDIPNFPESFLEENSNFIVGTLQGKRIIYIQSKVINFQRYSEDEIEFLMKLLKKIGVEFLIIVNAVESINQNLKQGDLVVIKDHIKIFESDILSKYINLSQCNKQDMVEIVESISEVIGIDIKKGVYGDVSQENYINYRLELPHHLDCDIIGIPTISEVIIANFCNINVLELSYVCNIDNNISSNNFYKCESSLISLLKETIAVL